MHRKILLFAIGLFFIAISTAFAGIDKSHIAEKIKTAVVPFVANKGQVDGNVSFYAKTLSGTLFVTKEGELVYSLPKLEAPDTNQDKEKQDVKYSGGVILREKIVNTIVDKVTADREAVAKVNYFKGNDPDKWQSGVTTFEEISLGEVYDGIELRLKAYGDNVEKLFYVNPGADPTLIRVALSGAEKLAVLDSGELQASTRLGDVHFTKPVAWQVKNGKRIPVPVAYDIALHDQVYTYSFQIESYDKSSPLVIDPLLASTFIGNSDGDYGYSIAIDNMGSVFVAGTSYSVNYPTNPIATEYDTVNDGSGDIVISKLSADLSSLIATTFLGGAGYEQGNCITIDNSGNVYVTGKSNSADFPTKTGGVSVSHNGGDDIIVSKLSSDLRYLLASTYLGGTGSDSGNSITLDSAGNLYVTGLSSSATYPTTTNAHNETHNGNNDVVISKLSSDFSSLLASTYVGGGAKEAGSSITLDSVGNVYVFGLNEGGSYPVTAGAYDQEFNGGRDYVISKLSSDLETLIASTYLGGASWEGRYVHYSNGKSIALDSIGNVFVTGISSSTDYPTTPGSYGQTYNGGSLDTVISKLTGDLSTLVSSTFLGGSNSEEGYPSIAIDSADNVYVLNFSFSLDFPTTSGAYAPTLANDGYPAAVISRLSPDLSTLIASTYFGGYGNGVEGWSIALNSEGNVYITGYALEWQGGSSFPTSVSAYDPTFNGTWDIFVSRLSSDLSAISSQYQLDVTKHGSGTGLIFSDNVSGIWCDADCSQDYDYDQLVELIAAPDPDSTFTGWVGDGCNGTNTTCSVTMDQARIVVANFVSDTFELTVNKAGSGRGTVTSVPAGISCSSFCDSDAASFGNGDTVTLSVTNVHSGSVFNGWSGGGCSGIGDCVVNMDDNVSVTATFDVGAVYTTNSKAIIVAGYGEHSTNWLWEETKLNTNHAYSVLRDQGYTKDMIRYLNSVSQVDPTDGNIVYADSNLTKFKEAIVWAADADDVLIYLVGHGNTGDFIMKHNDSVHEVLHASIFNGWLNTLQQTMTGRLVVIYDACFSGSFISPLSSAYNRIIMTSSADDEKSKFINSGRLSFSYQFWSVVYEGALVSIAFDHADSMMTSQTGWFDINGNGQPMDSSDVFPDFVIGAGIKNAASTMPIITSVAPDQLLQKKGDSALLWASVDYSGVLTDVWALLIPPDYDPSAPDTDTIELPTVPLTYSNPNQRYETNYTGFKKGGTYKVWYYAMNDAQEISLPPDRPSTVKVSSFPWIFMTPILSIGQMK